MVLCDETHRHKALQTENVSLSYLRKQIRFFARILGYKLLCLVEVYLLDTIMKCL